MSLIYVICPVTADPIHREKRRILESLAQELHVELGFPLDSPTLPDIKGTLRALNDCDVVVADLSFERPSCYFELGVARALKKPVFAICNIGSAVHQGIDTPTLETFGTLKEFEVVTRRALTNLANKASLTNRLSRGQPGANAKSKD